MSEMTAEMRTEARSMIPKLEKLSQLLPEPNWPILVITMRRLGFLYESRKYFSGGIWSIVEGIAFGI